MDEALDSALYSALDYPPALAVAAEYLRIKFPSGAEVSDFCETALKALHFYLGDQIHSPFFVARAATDGDEIRAGDFRWIVAVSNLRDQVLWVSYQSILEEADFETFGLSRDFLEKRFAGRRLFDFDPSVYEERSSPRSGTS